MKVICNCKDDGLTVGKIYVVMTQTSGGTYVITCDDGMTRTFQSSLFEKIEEDSLTEDTHQEVNKGWNCGHPVAESCADIARYRYKPELFD